MTDREQEPDWPILQSKDLAFLWKTRGAMQAQLDTNRRWTELMKSIVDTIPREREEGRSEKFGQDALGKGLLAGISTEEVEAALADTGQQGRLRMFLKKIDRRIVELTREQSSSGEFPAQRQEPAA